MYSIVEITPDGEYGMEYSTSLTYDEALDASSNAYTEEGMRTEILKLTSLKDAYGIETDMKAWIPVLVLEELGVEI